MPTTTQSDTIGGVPVSTTTTYPDYATDSVTIGHDISLGAQDTDEINIAIAIDRSGSTAQSSGSDVDGDGDIDSYLEAQQIAAKELFDHYVQLGYDPSRVTITLVDYSTNGQVVGIYNLDDQDAFNSAVDALTPTNLTNYEDPLQDIIASWTAQDVDPNANNTVIFLSDGIPNRGGSVNDEVQTLTNTFNANISAIGVGANSSLTDLNDVDNTGGAVKVTDASQLINEITSPPPIVDVDSVTITFTYQDPNDPTQTITATHTFNVGDTRMTPTPTGYRINDLLIDLVPPPPVGTDVHMQVVTSFNNGADSISTGVIAVPAYHCFASTAMIMTLTGEVRAGELQIGDMVMTRDHGPQPLRWVGKRAVAAAHLRGQPNVRPIRIRAGALGPHNPRRDLIVSPQHRILVTSAIAERMFGETEVLVAAKNLLPCHGVEVAEDLETVEYVHFTFDRHELVFSDGAMSESMFAGAQALNMLLPEQREELLAIFPEWQDADFAPVSARLLPKGAHQKSLIARHIRNEKALAGDLGTMH